LAVPRDGSTTRKTPPELMSGDRATPGWKPDDGRVRPRRRQSVRDTRESSAGARGRWAPTSLPRRIPATLPSSWTRRPAIDPAGPAEAGPAPRRHGRRKYASALERAHVGPGVAGATASCAGDEKTRGEEGGDEGKEVTREKLFENDGARSAREGRHSSQDYAAQLALQPRARSSSSPSTST